MQLKPSFEYYDLNYEKKISNILFKHINNKNLNNLANVKKILNFYNNPQNNLKIIHVAGTNGKGSISNMINSILCEEGYTVGLFTSPHLVSINERIKVSNKKILYDVFYDLLKKVDEDSNRLNIFLGFFDILTIVAFLYFYEKKCDYVVLETGLGGEYDATNVVDVVAICVITNIGLDHERILGDSIEKIALAKSGIIKKNCPVVLYDIENGKEVFIKKATEMGADVFLTDFSKIKIYNDNYFDYKSYKSLKTNMLGNFQIYNAATVIETIDALKINGLKIKDESIKSGLLNVKLDGRFQIIYESPFFIMDGGHNAQCIETVIKDINLFLEKNKIKKIVFLLSILNDKNMQKMIDKMYMNIKCDNIKTIITKVDNSRAYSIDYIYDYVKKYNNDIIKIANVKDAVDFCKNNIDSESLIYATGSLYLIGEILKYINCERCYEV